MSVLTQLYFCPVTATSRLIGKKWQPVIIERLMSGPKRFGEIRALIPGLSAKVLSDSLEQLERAGIVRRTVEAKRPVRIHYSLTDRGADLEAVIRSMKTWGDRWLHPKEATQRRPT